MVETLVNLNTRPVVSAKGTVLGSGTMRRHAWRHIGWLPQVWVSDVDAASGLGFTHPWSSRYCFNHRGPRYFLKSQFWVGYEALQVSSLSKFGATRTVPLSMGITLLRAIH